MIRYWRGESLEILEAIAFNLLVAIIGGILGWLAKLCFTNRKRISLFTKSKIYASERIRISAAYLFRIEIDGKYLLIAGKRIHQYQPVGGVYKVFAGFSHIKEDLNIHKNTGFDEDEEIIDDLRMTIPGKDLIKFIDWFDSRKDREVETLREFKEELVDSKYLPESAIFAFNPEYIKSSSRRLHFSKHFQMKELLMFDIYEIRLNDECKTAINNAIRETDKLVLASAEDIKKNCIVIHKQSVSIGEHALNIL